MGEACADGNSEEEACPYGVGWCSVCGADCRLVDVVGSFCGDGARDELQGEECDGGVDPQERCPYGTPSCFICTVDCRWLAVVESTCGDHIIDGGAGVGGQHRYPQRRVERGWALRGVARIPMPID